MDTFGVFAGASAAVTKAVDFIRNLIDHDDRLPKWVWNLIAFAIGILVSTQSNMNLLTGTSIGVHVSSTTAQVITGFALGAGGSGFHELFDWLSSSAKKAGAVASGAVAGIDVDGPDEAVDET